MRLMPDLRAMRFFAEARQEPGEQAHQRNEGADLVDHLDAEKVGELAEQRRCEAAFAGAALQLGLLLDELEEVA